MLAQPSFLWHSRYSNSRCIKPPCKDNQILPEHKQNDEQFSGTDTLLNHAKLMEENSEDRQWCHETHQEEVDAEETLRDRSPVGKLILH